MSEEYEDYEDYVPSKRKTRTSPMMHFLMILSAFFIANMYMDGVLVESVKPLVQPFFNEAVSLASSQINLPL